jgi:HNH endonuclease
MARSRNIKPGFFTNDELAECEPLARLLFAGLWTEADREGRLEDRPKKIKAAILPYDDCNADELLEQLAARGFILRYQSGGAFIQITGFGKHQDPHYKEKASEIPAPPGHADTGKTAGASSDALRAEVLARDGACRRCQSTADLTLDHIIPRSKGGSHAIDNLQTLCRRCNSAKNNREARPIIGRSSADDKGGKFPLIPDSGFLIPSSLIPDSLFLDSSPLLPHLKPPHGPPKANQEPRTTLPQDDGPPEPTEPSGFAAFWDAWPKSPRKVARKTCALKWQRLKLSSQAQDILLHVEAMKQTKQWTTGYEPAPITYLNGERWRDGLPEDAATTSDGYI